VAVFLDRDGVLNVPEFREGRSFAPRIVADFRLYEDVPAALAALKEAGFALVVVTNQPDIGAGLVDPAEIEKMHARLTADLPIDLIEVSTETSAQAAESGSQRRKPAPGMLIEAARKLGVDLGASYMVGDRAGDIEAGRAAGCAASVFVDRSYTAEPAPTGHAVRVAGLGAAADWILNHRTALAARPASAVHLRKQGASRVGTREA
jgi:D-glycero-D-manno-heptose 1,7-bisphosphate phosphatase